MHGRVKRTTVTTALLVLVTTACGGASDAGSSSRAGSTPSAAAPPASSPSPSASSAALPTTPAGPTFSITYAAGRVTGDTGRLKVKLGAEVVIRVTSDVADEVHLHGYDVSVKVAAGGTALVSFTAKIPGVWELELEKLGKPLAKVQVQ